jgi:hypothetical protein
MKQVASRALLHHSPSKPDSFSGYATALFSADGDSYFLCLVLIVVLEVFFKSLFICKLYMYIQQMVEH